MIEGIITSTNEDYVNESIKRVIDKEIKRISHLSISDYNEHVSSLKSIPLYEKGKGLPIGNMTSQILAVFYLNDLDHFVKEKLKIKYYVIIWMILSYFMRIEIILNIV